MLKSCQWALSNLAIIMLNMTMEMELFGNTYVKCNLKYISPLNKYRFLSSIFIVFNVCLFL